MSDDKKMNAQQRRDPAKKQRLLFAGASVGGALALIAAIGVAIVVTFPKPDTSIPAAELSAADQADSAASSIATSSVPSAAESTATAAIKEATASKSTAHATVKSTPALPLGMKKTLPGSRQMIIATGSKLGATRGTLRIYNLTGSTWKQVFSAPCRFGINGLVDGTKRKEGSRTTPTGIWWPGTWVWGWHAKPPSSTKMPYKQTTEKVWWSCERNSTYNTWVVSSHHVDGEHLVDVRVQYEYAFSTGYNAPPNRVVRGRGTAIFLHVFGPPDYLNGFTSGCVSVSRKNMINIFRTLDPALKPCFAIGTEKTGTSTSITSY